MEFSVVIKDINRLAVEDVTAIMSRLSWPDSGSNSSIQKELHKRYLVAEPGQKPSMMLAFVRLNGALIGWVGTRPWPEKFKGNPIIAQTVECFVDENYRRKGIARLGLQALISAGFIDKSRPVSVYAAEVVPLAESCGCKIVIYCESEE
jgi:hypothetical protein